MAKSQPSTQKGDESHEVRKHGLGGLGGLEGLGRVLAKTLNFFTLNW